MMIWRCVLLIWYCLWSTVYICAGVEYKNNTVGRRRLYIPTCPIPTDIQDPNLLNSFDLNKYVGVIPYYILGLHDYAQPQRSGCIRSWNKFQDPNQTYIVNNFTQSNPYYCPNIPLISEIDSILYDFYVTDQLGVLRGDFNGFTYSNIIVAVGDNPSGSNNEYRWGIEFQCIEFLNIVSYIGIQFYSRISNGPDAEINFNEMYNKSIQLGIDYYWKKSIPRGMRRIDPTGCDYNNQQAIPSKHGLHSLYNKIQILSGKCRPKKVF